MPEGRTDYENLISAPRTIYDEVSLKLGAGGAEYSFPNDGDVKLVRLLPGLGSDCNGKALGCIVFISARHHANLYEMNRVELHWGVPETQKGFEEIGAVRHKPLLTLHAGVRHSDKYKLLGILGHQLSASAQFAFSDGFSFITYGRYWPLVNEMLNRFHELTHGFDWSFETKVEKAA